MSHKQLKNGWPTDPPTTKAPAQGLEFLCLISWSLAWLHAVVLPALIACFVNWLLASNCGNLQLPSCLNDSWLCASLANALLFCFASEVLEWLFAGLLCLNTFCQLLTTVLLIAQLVVLVLIVLFLVAKLLFSGSPLLFPSSFVSDYQHECSCSSLSS